MNRLHRRKTTAAVLVAVLVCLLVVIAIAGSLVRNVLLQRRQLIQSHRQLQAHWLAESAVDRAIAMLRESGGYAGETWRVEVAGTGVEDTGVVEIGVAPVDGAPQQRRVTVRARYPGDSLQSVTESKTVLVVLPEPGEER